MRLHPDLLFALDLAGPSPPSGAAPPADQADAAHDSDRL